MEEKLYSLYGLLDSYYEAKRTYYTSGKATMTDQAYDSLESSIVNIHGKDVFDKWGVVGYCPKKHETITNLFLSEKAKLKKQINKRY